MPGKEPYISDVHLAVLEAGVEDVGQRDPRAHSTCKTKREQLAAGKAPEAASRGGGWGSGWVWKGRARPPPYC